MEITVTMLGFALAIFGSPYMGLCLVFADLEMPLFSFICFLISIFKN